jgi:hypothetical protein
VDLVIEFNERLFLSDVRYAKGVAYKQRPEYIYSAAIRLHVLVNTIFIYNQLQLHYTIFNNDSYNLVHCCNLRYTVRDIYQMLAWLALTTVNSSSSTSKLVNYQSMAHVIITTGMGNHLPLILE